MFSCANPGHASVALLRVTFKDADGAVALDNVFVAGEIPLRENEVANFEQALERANILFSPEICTPWATAFKCSR